MLTETLFYTSLDEVKVHIKIRETKYFWSVRQIVILHQEGSYSNVIIVVYEKERV